jgi:hypothetical protein
MLFYWHIFVPVYNIQIPLKLPGEVSEISVHDGACPVY